MTSVLGITSLLGPRALALQIANDLADAFLVEEHRNVPRCGKQGHVIPNCQRARMVDLVALSADHDDGKRSERNAAPEGGERGVKFIAVHSSSIARSCEGSLAKDY